MDSMIDGHDTEEICMNLKRFLIEEWNNSIVTGVYDEYKIIDTIQESMIHNIPYKRMQVPLQENDFDCGVFLLYYIKQFIANANSWTSNELDLDLSDWFYPCEASRLRTIIQQDLQGLFDVKKQTQTGIFTSYVLHQSSLI